MRALRFHREIYDGEAVDEAVKVFERFGDFGLSEEGAHWVVSLTAHKPDQEKRIAGELMNYALGLTMRRRGAS